MAETFPTDHRLFERRYAEMKAFSAAMEQYHKANKKAFAALQDATAALDKLSLCFHDLGQGSDMPDTLKSTLLKANHDIVGFKAGNSYQQLAQVLWNQMKRYTTPLEAGAELLKAVGKERKSAKDNVDKYMKKRQKDDKYQFKLQEAQQALMAKDEHYNESYDAVRRQREEYVPIMLHNTLKATYELVADLAQSLRTARDCVGSFLGGGANDLPAEDEMQRNAADAPALFQKNKTDSSGSEVYPNAMVPLPVAPPLFGYPHAAASNGSHSNGNSHEGSSSTPMHGIPLAASADAGVDGGGSDPEPHQKNSSDTKAP